jgi:hypothetical protein
MIVHELGPRGEVRKRYRRILMAVALMSWALLAAPGFAQDQAIVGIQTQSN